MLDQVTKLYVQAHMVLYESIALIPNYLDITYTQNPGAAFSMFANLRSGSAGVSAVDVGAAIIVLTVLVLRAARISLTSIAFALILGGAAGNLIDRALRGRVIDFIRVHYYDLNYPIFNVADSAITIGVALIILVSFFGHDDDAEAPKPNRSS